MATWDPSLSSFLLSLIFILCQLVNSIEAQAPTNWTTFPFNPPSLPLAVKNPYLNAWAPLAGGSAAINQAAPRSYLPLANVGPSSLACILHCSLTTQFPSNLNGTRQYALMA